MATQPGILPGGAETAAPNPQSAPSSEKEVGQGYSDLEHVSNLGYSDLEVADHGGPGLEVAGGDAAQAVLPRHYYPAPKFEEHQGQSSTGAAAEFQYNGGQNPFEPSARSTSGARLCGLERRTFWIVLGIVALSILLALGVGVGVGVGLGGSDDTAASTTASDTTTSSANATAAASATNTLPAAVATGTATANIGIVCPAANRTLYNMPTSATDQKFLVLCGRDYNSAGGAVDLASMNMTTFEGCLEQCVATDGCLAVGWGTYYDVNTCWLKSTIGSPNWSAGWYSAVMDNDG